MSKSQEDAGGTRAGLLRSWGMGFATSVLLLVHRVPLSSPSSGKHRPRVELSTGLCEIPQGPGGCPLSHLLSSCVLEWQLMLGGRIWSTQRRGQKFYVASGHWREPVVGDSSQLPKEQDLGHCHGRSQVGSRCLLSVPVGLEVSLAHGMGSWRIHTGHPKHLVGLRQAGLLPGHGEAETGDTYFYPTGKEGCEIPPCCWEPQRHEKELQGSKLCDIISHGTSWLAGTRACAWDGLPGREQGQRGTGTVITGFWPSHLQ